MDFRKFFIDDTLDLLMKSTQYDKFIYKLRRMLVENFTGSTRAVSLDVIERILKGSGKLTSKEIKAYEKEVKERLGEKLAEEVEDVVNQETVKLFEYSKKRFALDNSKGGGVFPSLDSVDLRCIDMLNRANTTWIGDHGVKSPVTKAVSDTLVNARKMKLTRDQTALLLRRKFGDLVPEKIAEKYGEDRYFDGFVRGHATRVRGFSDINSMKKAGYSSYIIYSRLSERTCPICKRLHGTVCSVDAALNNMETYFEGAKLGDSGKMKKAFPWQYEKLPPNKAPTAGLMPPFHFRCECRIRVYREKLGEISVSEKSVNLANKGRRVIFLDRGEDGSSKTRERHQIIYSFLDGAGKEWHFTENSLTHCKEKINKGSHLRFGKKDPVGYRKTVSAVQNPRYIGINPLTEDMTFIGDNGYVVVMRDNIVWTSYFGGYAKGNSLEKSRKASKEMLKKKGFKVYG